MGIQVKSVPFYDVKADMDKRTFQGYAATWDLDSHEDVIVRGAFDKTIRERGPRDANGETRSRIKILWQHMSMWPIGIPLVMKEVTEGLYVEGRISKIPRGDEALELMRDGTVDTMSIGYNAVKHEFNTETEVRYLHEVKLYEFSPVTFPANENAEIVGVKDMAELVVLKDMAEVDVNQWAALQDVLKNSANIQELKAALVRLTSGRPPLPASGGQGTTGDDAGQNEPHSGKEDPGPDSVGGLQSLLQSLKKMNADWSQAHGREAEGGPGVDRGHQG